MRPYLPFLTGDMLFIQFVSFFNDKVAIHYTDFTTTKWERMQSEEH